MLLGILGFALGCLIVYLFLSPKVKSTKKHDEVIEKINSELRQELISLQEEAQDMISKREEEIKNYNQILNNIHEKEIEYYNLVNNLQDRFDMQANKVSKKYQKLEEEYEKEYLNSLNDSCQEYQKIISNTQDKINSLQNQYNELHNITLAAIEANKRKQEIEENDKFYKLILTDIDLQEIKKLKEVSQYLRDTEPLNKVIWKVYYEKPYTDLIGRVIGSKTITGIYKITNLKNNMCYIGQAVNIADRWRQHIKRGIGAETPTRNKLYPAMTEYGVENFSFEIIEECTRDKLNQREDFWQEYFKAKEFGYSIK